MYAPAAVPVPMDFAHVFDAVRAGEVQAGVVIHEGQLTFEDEGLQLIRDLGEWWGSETDGLPLPLGGNAVRRDLGEKAIREVSRLLRDAIAYSLAHRDEALDYALEYGRGLSRDKADEFVGMYVNDRTLDYGEDGRRAVRLFLARAFDLGLIPRLPEPEFVA
jgi:1,4-dihydroxy-6-naphthoate synthase